MNRKTRTVTIRDVANSAGVSISTISRVLNNKTDVSAETQQHVLEVISSLGYTSTLAAQSMRSMRTNVIGLIVPNVEYPFSLEVLKGVNRFISSSKYDLLVFTTGGFEKQDTAVHEQQCVSRLNGTITDGIIVLTPSASFFSSNAPIVSIDPLVLIDQYPTIYSDSYQGGIEAMRYLIGLGHRRIAYISGRSGLQNMERYRAYCDELEKSKIAYDPDLVVEGDFSADRGRTCAYQLLGLRHPPSAIFAANDQSAVGALEAAKELGVRIPEDLSLVGYDNIPEAQFYELTTIDQSLIQMGSMAVELLIKLIEGENIDSAVIKLLPRLIIRRSCQAMSA